MATVRIEKRKRAKRYSHIVYYKDPVSGQKKYYKTFQRQKDAHLAANELRVLIDSGKLPAKKKPQIRPLKFKEVGELVKYEWFSRRDNGELKEKTVEDYIITLNVVNRTFGEKLLSIITEEEIERYRTDVVQNLSKISSNKRLFIIKKVFKKGLIEGAVILDTTQNIKLLSEKSHQRNRFLLPPILDKLIEASKETRAKFYLPSLILLGAEHGASKQEALSLLWGDIDFDFENLGTIRFFRTKNGNERTEYLMPRTKDALLKWRVHQDWMRHRKKVNCDGSGLVFCRLNGKPVKRFDTAWRNICKKVGLKNFHFHDMRHTFASNLLLSGSDLKDVKEMIGHSDISMTDRYAHLTKRHKLSRQEKLAEHYSNGSKPIPVHTVHDVKKAE